jgi:Mn2+/Fe2+ NRAMP family transporter
MSTKKPEKNRAFWPVIGFVLAVALFAIAFVLAPEVNKFLKGRLPNYPRATQQLNLIMAVILWLIMGSIVSLSVAIAMPKKKSAVSEKDVDKARKAMVAEKVARKKRQQELNKQMKSR